MNAIRCPNCSAANALSAAQCKACGASFASLPSTAYVSVPIEQVYAAPAANAVPQDNETGRKTFFWYRVYCAVMMIVFLAVAVSGILVAVTKPESPEYSPQEMVIMGVVYTIIGAVLLIIFGIALFLPRKPFNWIIGIVAIALGMTSCCSLPFSIPLLIYWLKPETKAYFGRS